MPNRRTAIVTVFVLLTLFSSAFQTASGMEWLRQWLSGETRTAEGQYRIGWRYFKGDDVPQDKEKAVEWFRRSAEQGHMEAQTMLGWCY